MMTKNTAARFNVAIELWFLRLARSYHAKIAEPPQSSGPTESQGVSGARRRFAVANSGRHPALSPTFRAVSGEGWRRYGGGGEGWFATGRPGLLRFCADRPRFLLTDARRAT